MLHLQLPVIPAPAPAPTATSSPGWMTPPREEAAYKQRHIFSYLVLIILINHCISSWFISPFLVSAMWSTPGQLHGHPLTHEVHLHIKCYRWIGLGDQGLTPWRSYTASSASLISSNSTKAYPFFKDISFSLPYLKMMSVTKSSSHFI